MANGISLKIEEELLRNIHIRAARKGKSLQGYLTELIERDLFPERFPQLTERQMQELQAALRQVDDGLRLMADTLGIHQEQQKEVSPLSMRGI